MSNILIIGDEEDPHVGEVCACLKKNGVDYFIINPFLGSSNTITYTYDPFNIVFSYKDRSINYSEITSVWWRFKPLLRNYPNDIGEFETRNFIKREWQLSLDPLKHFLKDRFWINSRESDWITKNKPYQLALAKELGFAIPNGIISNNSSVIQEKTKEYTQFLYKPLSYFIIPPDRVLYSSVMTDKELNSKKENIALAPCIFQEYIEKEYEVRITVVGTEVFPVKINSQEKDETKFDWRKDQVNLRYETLEIPNEIRERLLKLHSAFGIYYGAFDFIVSPDGSYHFLEVNPSGQWLWMGKSIGRSISETIAEALIRGE